MFALDGDRQEFVPTKARGHNGITQAQAATA
jgi:hypothetical protein